MKIQIENGVKMEISMLISIVALVMSGFQTLVNRERLGIDLYDRRFEIYSRSMDLYLTLPEYKNFNNLTEDQKTQVKEYKKILKEYVKYEKESIFLFEKKDSVIELIKELRTKIEVIVFYIYHTDSDILTDKDIQLMNDDLNNRIELNKILQNFEDAIGPYLSYANYKPIKLSKIFHNLLCKE